MPNSRFLTQVLPFDASQDAQGYTYSVPENLVADVRVGQLVQIPLREHTVFGIIAHLHEIPQDTVTDELKEVERIVEPVPLLQPEQLRTMLHYAEKHAIHIHKVAALFLPAPIRNRIVKYGLEPAELTDTQSVPLGYPTPELVFFPNSEQVLQEAGQLLRQPGVAIITPSDIFTQKVLGYIDGTRESVGVFDAGMTETARAKFWIDTLRNKYDSVI